MKQDCNYCSNDTIDKIIRTSPTKSIEIGEKLIEEDAHDYMGYYLSATAKVAKAGDLPLEQKLESLAEAINLLEKANTLEKNNKEVIKSLFQAYSSRYQSLRDANKSEPQQREHRRKAELYRRKYEKLTD